MPLPRPFDGFVEHTKRVSPTCLVTFERVRYSVPASFANRPVSLRVYPDRIVIAADGSAEWRVKQRFTEEVIAAYTALHQRGLAHSVEHWQGDQLIGGLYCVALGKMVYGESMFATQTDASKVAFAHFVYWLKSQNVHIIDCQQATAHLMSMGARTVSRKVFESEMANSIVQPTLNWEPRELKWTYDQT